MAFLPGTHHGNIANCPTQIIFLNPSKKTQHFTWEWSHGRLQLSVDIKIVERLCAHFESYINATTNHTQHKEKYFKASSHFRGYQNILFKSCLRSERVVFNSFQRESFVSRDNDFVGGAEEIFQTFLPITLHVEFWWILHFHETKFSLKNLQSFKNDHLKYLKEDFIFSIIPNQSR